MRVRPATGHAAYGTAHGGFVGQQTPRWYGGLMPPPPPLLASCIHPNCFRVELTQCRASWLAYLLLDTIHVSPNFCFLPGISPSAQGPKWPENPVFRDFPLVGVQAKNMLNIRGISEEKLCGHPYFFSKGAPSKNPVFRDFQPVGVQSTKT